MKYTFILPICFLFTYGLIQTTPTTPSTDKTIPSFITKEDLEDLQFEKLVFAINSTKTDCGYESLRALLMPTNNKESIINHQHIIKTIYENESLYTELTTLLDELKLHEAALLAYQKGNATGAETFYFQRPSLLSKKSYIWRAINYITNSEKTLELSTVGLFVYALLPLFYQLGVNTVAYHYGQWLREERLQFNVFESMKEGLETPIRTHSVYPRLTHERVTKNIQQRFTMKDAFTILAQGTWRDTFELFKQGTKTNDVSIFNLISWKNNELWLFNKWKIKGAGLDKPSIFDSITGFCGASLMTAMHDLFLYNICSSAYTSFMGNVNTIHAIKNRLYHVKEYILTAQKLNACLEKYHINLLQKTLTHPKVAEPATIVTSRKTFNSPGGFFYRRGVVLYAEKALREITNPFKPLLQKIGIVDAYVSIVTFIKQSEKQGLPICFTIPTETPGTIQIIDGWLPTTIDVHITNSIELGNGKATGIILSGPHGCGKSSTLEMLGQTGILTHSVGIACGSQVTISLCSGIRATLKSVAIPGFSTFMAAQKDMLRIKEFMKSLPEGETGMILLGEPYKGTVEAEAAFQINQLCEQFAQTSHVLMALETHVYEPTQWEFKLPSKFTNGQMTIIAHNDGTFERTFKLAPGLATWWFENAPLRSAYIQWIGQVVRSTCETIN